MSAWLDKLQQALDNVCDPVVFFFRDDDAGWGNNRLIELLDLFARYLLPVDVAAIPAAVDSELALELRARIEAAPEKLAVHQHGFAHRNHEAEGRRKCEFGVARSPELQQIDIESGKRRLFDLFGPLVSPIFTPPWNRCTVVTSRYLREAGFRVLSRDATAVSLNLAGLFELPVTVDWFAQRRGVRLSFDELGSTFAASVSNGAPVGVMFHHAVMDEEERQVVSEMLALLASHRNADCRLMEGLVAASCLQTTSKVMTGDVAVIDQASAATAESSEA